MSDANPSPDQTLDAIRKDGIVLCIRLDAADGLLDICRAALRGGLGILEITLTTPGALDAIEALSAEPGAIVGAGTVLTTDDVRDVALAGGRFALSPIFDPAVVDTAESLGILAIPGASTPTEIIAAHRHGARAVKVFPAGALGGPDYLRAIRGPLPFVDLIPTSGPAPHNVADYLAAGAIAVGFGRDVIAPGAGPAQVESAARRARGALTDARG